MQTMIFCYPASWHQGLDVSEFFKIWTFNFLVIAGQLLSCCYTVFVLWIPPLSQKLSCQIFDLIHLEMFVHVMPVKWTIFQYSWCGDAIIESNGWMWKLATKNDKWMLLISKWYPFDGTAGWAREKQEFIFFLSEYQNTTKLQLDERTVKLRSMLDFQTGKVEIRTLCLSMVKKKFILWPKKLVLTHWWMWVLWDHKNVFIVKYRDKLEVPLDKEENEQRPDGPGFCFTRP